MKSNRRAFIRSAAATAVAAGSGLLLSGAANARSAPQSDPVPAPVAPRRIIALEEHFILPEFVGYLAETKQNIRLTTSGVCSDSALRCALDAFGSDNVMFSIDYPFEDSKTAVEWIKRANLTEAERHAVAYGNAERILHLA